jgi:hypothetical protein
MCQSNNLLKYIELLRFVRIVVGTFSSDFSRKLINLMFIKYLFRCKSLKQGENLKTGIGNSYSFRNQNLKFSFYVHIKYNDQEGMALLFLVFIFYDLQENLGMFGKAVCMVAYQAILK